MPDVLPIYCETALNPSGAFPVEPVNTYTSLFPVLTGILAVVFLLRGRHKDPVAWSLAVLTILTGCGSVAWHGLRTQPALVLDALPGVIYFAVLVFVWFANVGSRALAIAMVALFAAFVVLVPLSVKQQIMLAIIAVLLVVAGALLIATWRKRRGAFGWAALMVASGVFAAAMRTLDLHVCEVVPVGTHFLWHIFLGLAAYAGVRMIVALRAAKDEAAPIPPA